METLMSQCSTIKIDCQANTVDTKKQTNVSGEKTRDTLNEVPPEIEHTAPNEKSGKKEKKKAPIDLSDWWDGLSTDDTQKAKIHKFLVGERGIDPKVVDKHIANGNLKYKKIKGSPNVLAAYKGKDGLPAVQRLTMKSKDFIKGSEAGSECFFIAGCEAKNTDTIMIHESPISALSGECQYPDICHVAIGSTTLTGKVSKLKGLNKKILVAQENGPAGETMLVDIVKILGSKVKGINWADTAKAKIGMNEILLSGEKPEIDKVFVPAWSLSRKNNKTFKLTRLSKMKLKPADWLVKGYIEVDSMVEVFGPSGGGKTFCVVDLACSCATGTDFNGIPVKQGPVIYVAGEGQNGIQRRFTACGKHKGVDMDTADIFISNIPAGLTDPQQVEFVIDAIHAIADEVAPPVAIIFDTIARNFGPGDENSTRDMTQFVKAGDEIRSLYRSAVIYVHHTGLAEQGRARGSSVLKGALDAEYRVEMDNNGIVRLENTKMKDHDKPKPMAFKLESVELGFSADGDPITSAVLISENYVPPSKGTAARQGKWQTVTEGILRDLVKDHISNTKPQNTTNGCVVKILIADVKDKAIKKGLDPRTWYRYPPYLKSLDGVILNEQYFEVDATSATSATLLQNV